VGGGVVEKEDGGEDVVVLRTRQTLVSTLGTIKGPKDGL
jgi:hypothetical protein